MTIPNKTINTLGTANIANKAMIAPAHDAYAILGDSLNHLMALAMRLEHPEVMDASERQAWAEWLRETAEQCEESAL